MAFTSPLAEAAFLVGRALFALVVSYLAVGNLLDLEASVGYAKSKGAPLASVTVPLGSVGLIAGSLSVLAGVYPAVGAAAILVFLGPITVVMHDFWTMEGQDRQNEEFHFLKNVGLLGGALVFLALSSLSWPLAVGVGL
ncbi:DoxX family membrane protein [Haloarcula salinisoli]|uniref:Quinol oxidase n=1 Tax=Haloarcula salinisoli TaxID=2487746 RepID=A0A8J8CD00_9EURY|nr:DoxX family membrane protein [Halomicroarcula salinisoli]MBX0286848.1 quinol oxidase [Halomicroarcula salinisoli]MBX0304150.1 quinol oxidase [Halomicroarcula salinisoli]